MIHRLIMFLALLVGAFTVVLLAAIFFKDLVWWSWLPISARPVLLTTAVFINLAAFMAVSISRRISVAPFQLPVMVCNLVLFILTAIIVGSMYFLENIFHM